jgi:hypothetical protein
MLCTSLILQIPVSSLDRRDGSGVPRQHCLTIEKQTTDVWPTTLYPAALISQWSPLHGLVSLLAQLFLFFLFLLGSDTWSSPVSDRYVNFICCLSIAFQSLRSYGDYNVGGAVNT